MWCTGCMLTFQRMASQYDLPNHTNWHFLQVWKLWLINFKHYNSPCRHYFQKPPGRIVNFPNLYSATRTDFTICKTIFYVMCTCNLSAHTWKTDRGLKSPETPQLSICWQMGNPTHILKIWVIILTTLCHFIQWTTFHVLGMRHIMHMLIYT